MAFTCCRCCCWKALFLLLAALATDVACLASVNNAPSSSSSSRILQVVSTKRDGGLSKTYVFGDHGAISVTKSNNKTSNTNGSSDFSLSHSIQKFQAALRSTFLPSGFPTKTPHGYLPYSMWSWIQDVTTQLRSVLATQRVLEGVGVGREGASALSALLNFLVRDGCGMAATLLFTSVASSRFKTDVKRWRLFADIMVDLGITLEVAATQMPKALFLPMISVGNMCKAMCGVAAGACGGAINLHWAKGSDISDINAKFGAQHTVTVALGLVLAAVFARSVSTLNQTKLWVLYTSLTALHIVANMQCMKLIAFESFNNARMNLILEEFLNNSTDTCLNSDCPPLEDQQSHCMNPPVKLRSPQEIARVEPLFFVRQSKVIPPVPIEFGVSLDEFAARTNRTGSDLEVLLQNAHQSDCYLLATAVSQRRRGARQRPRTRVMVSFLFHASAEQQAKAYYHAVLLGRQLERVHSEIVDGVVSNQAIEQAEIIAKDELQHSWDAFVQSCRHAGWDLSKTELRSRGYELECMMIENT